HGRSAPRRSAVGADEAGPPGGVRSKKRRRRPPVRKANRPMDWPIPTLADVLRARAALAPHLRPTPTLEPPALGAALGCRALLKCENLNPTGAFKVRGGINLVSTLSPDQRARGVL